MLARPCHICTPSDGPIFRYIIMSLDFTLTKASGSLRFPADLRTAVVQLALYPAKHAASFIKGLFAVAAHFAGA